MKNEGWKRPLKIPNWFFLIDNFIANLVSHEILLQHLTCFYQVICITNNIIDFLPPSMCSMLLIICFSHWNILSVKGGGGGGQNPRPVRKCKFLLGQNMLRMFWNAKILIITTFFYLTTKYFVIAKSSVSGLSRFKNIYFYPWRKKTYIFAHMSVKA